MEAAATPLFSVAVEIEFIVGTNILVAPQDIFLVIRTFCFLIIIENVVIRRL